MNTKILIGIVALVLLVGAGYYLVSKHSTNETGAITIGFLGPLTGDAASLAENALAATQVAVDEVNATGGINGRQVKLISEDGACDGATAANAVQKLINIDHVVGIIGGLCSAEALAAAPIAEQAKVPAIAYCATAPTVTTAGEYTFRTVPSDSYEGAFDADYIYNTLHKKKVAILATNGDWGDGVKDAFTTEFEKIGGTIVFSEGFDQKTTDFKTQLAKVRVASPDLLYFVSYTDAGVAAIKQMHQLGLSLPVFGGNSWTDPTIWQEVGSAGDGMYYSQPYVSENADFEKKLNVSTMPTCSPQAYDAANALFTAIKQVGTNGESIKGALYKIKLSNTISAPTISFDKNGDVIGAQFVVTQRQSGKPVELK